MEGIKKALNKTKNDIAEKKQSEETARSAKKLKNSGEDFISLSNNDDFVPITPTAIKTPNQSFNKPKTSQEASEIPPWLSQGDSVQMTLEDEVWKFYGYIKPTQAENILKDFIIAQLTSIIKGLWRESTVEVFGSHSTKISLPTRFVN